jgi:hypothetical protein
MNTAIDAGKAGEVKVTKFHRALRRQLTKDEIVDIAQRSSRLASEIEQQEEELKTSTKHAKARIDELAAEKRRLELEIVDGGRLEETQCERRVIYRVGVVQEVRCDTGQILDEKPLSDRERQLALELPTSEDAKGDPGAIEGGEGGIDDDDHAEDDDSDDDHAEDEPDASEAGDLSAEHGETEEDTGIVDDDYNPHASDVDEDPPTEFPSSADDEEPLPTQKKAKAKRARKTKGRGQA